MDSNPSVRTTHAYLPSKRIARGLPAVAALTLVGGLVLSSSASAAKQIFRPLNATCGMAIVDPKAEHPTFVLQNNLTNCSTDGLRFKASNVTLDLNGRNIRGLPFVAGPPASGFGEGVGIRLVGNSNVTVTNSKATGGEISDFDAGMVIQGGLNNPASGNIVKNIKFINNRGDQNGTGGSCSDPEAVCEVSDFNDGLALVNATGNTIGPNNVFRANGSGGVRVDDSALNNTITGNLIESNLGNGVRFLSATSGNVVELNTSRFNGGSGVALSFENPNNIVRNNTLHKNRGAGVATSFHSEFTLIQNNTITDNGAGGITLGSGDNTLSGNTITNNGRGLSGAGPVLPNATFRTTGRGNGIQVGTGTDNFPRVGMIVTNNTVTGSGGNGIRINCVSDQDPENFAIYGCIGGYDTHDTVTGNTATGNGVNAGGAAPVGTLGVPLKQGIQTIGFFDLLDSTNLQATLTPFDPASSPAIDDPDKPNTGPGITDCGNNTWSGNTFNFGYPSCVH